MTEETETLVVSILRDVQGRVARLDRKLDDVREQLVNLNADHIAIKKDGIRQDEALAHLHLRQDRLEDAVARLNTRLGLIGPEA
jgi:hypothetical protein